MRDTISSFSSSCWYEACHPPYPLNFARISNYAILNKKDRQEGTICFNCFFNFQKLVVWQFYSNRKLLIPKNLLCLLTCKSIESLKRNEMTLHSFLKPFWGIDGWINGVYNWSSDLWVCWTINKCICFLPEISSIIDY